ncbi:MAG: DUF1778 domain-containing protein [archaeon]|nr:DUF1778 domain-containing protein [archaeon]
MSAPVIQVYGVSKEQQERIEAAAKMVGLKKNAFIVMAAAKEANKILKENE